MLRIDCDTRNKKSLHLAAEVIILKYYDLENIFLTALK